MPRGVAAKLGDTYTSANGYHYTRVDEGWRLTHHIKAEENLGRKLLPNERPYFKDGNKANIEHHNIGIAPRHASSVAKRIAQLNSRIAELVAERDALLARQAARETL